MHTRLFFGMLPRIPALFKRNRRKQQHWSARKEQGTIIGIKLLLFVYSVFGRRAFDLLLKPVIAYYHKTGKQARIASEDYLQRLVAFAQSKGHSVPDNLNSYHHLLSFGHTMLDKLAAWRGDYTFGNLTIHGKEHFDKVAASQQGIVVLGSHLGNLELCRALGRQYENVKINALVFTEHAERFNSVMKAVNTDSELNLIQVSQLGPDTAILLQQKLEQGEWVVIVGDRTSVTKEQRVVWADFLGQPAPFPQGPFMLSAVLKAPVYLLFGLRDEQQSFPHFNVYFEPFSDQIHLPRLQREQALTAVVNQYAKRLEAYTLQAPLQWFNFFNFWQLSENHNARQSTESR